MKDYPERFLVSYGSSLWVLSDGSVERPIMGAGPFIQFFESTEAAQEEIDRLSHGVYEADKFEIHPTHDD